MITLNRPSTFLLIPLLSLSTISAFAAPAQQEQLDQSRTQESERQERLNQERTEVVTPPPPPSELPADERVRFLISHVEIENLAERFDFLERLSCPYIGKELSLHDINELIGKMKKEKSYPDAPKTLYRMWLLDMDYVHPFEFSHRPATFTTSFHGQWTMDSMRLYGVDMISMGNRYTVRGFDGQVTLMGTNGWYLRSEFATKFPKQSAELYLGLDVGAVYGYGADLYNGHTIAGAAIGLRGKLSELSYDVFAAMPIRKPDGFHTADVTGRFSMGWKF
ncbi:hemolysin secretion/activation protein, ShlB/FhaC/HecB domain protein [Selenomonas sp. FOBRC9]|uniref:ShlB/FhaC/HecB family hemolysin secretion/activation protein n=1 Tax=Selenomonas sp. FOBRC9 TaxID=936573 RepID=UPI00027A4B15|nr:ShlB/FhaC/HecB family hemolysin secretion/activation protein [Selenomonas sp. FOBRC9]EJP33791.1 hemolysin secretion/activation protein, ShlB/FhaC/HecB domain protein [Selenomonas sp. FOBRC9]